MVHGELSPSGERAGGMEEWKEEWKEMEGEMERGPFD